MVSGDSAGHFETGEGDDRRQWLASFKEEVDAERAACRRGEEKWSWGRMGFFCGAVGFLILGNVLGAVAAGVCLVLFVLAIVRHHRARDQREFADRLSTVVEESGQRAGGKVVLIRSGQRPGMLTDGDVRLEGVLEAGPTWALTDQERDDLDVYAGPVGVFGLLNRTSTILGSRRLAELADHLCVSDERILARQAMIRWFDDHPGARLRLMAEAVRLRDRDVLLDRLVGAIRRAKELPFSNPKVLVELWSVFSGAAALYACGQMLQGGANWLFFFLGLLTFNGALFFRMRGALRECLGPWRDISLAVSGYLKMARRGESELPGETDLGRLRGCFVEVTGDALRGLDRWVAWTEAGGFMHALLNCLVLYDYHVAEAILSRVVPKREELLRGLSALADLEAVMSLACFAWEQPVRCYPEPTEERGIRMTGGVHPLIPPERVVANDMELTVATRMWIVTGSNMAGKSTLLRTVGINVLLGQMGTVATAGSCAGRRCG